MGCKKCDSKYVVNKWFQLCAECNNERLHGNKYGKATQYKEVKRKSLKTSNIKRTIDKGKVTKKEKTFKINEKIVEDELFYEKCFNQSNHKCEECGTKLPTDFRDEDGRVMYRARYSHIVPKSIAPELRHDENNINHLCLPCHQKWDFGNKKEMVIYAKNVVRFPNYLND
jgi:hypothetical protein